MRISPLGGGKVLGNHSRRIRELRESIGSEFDDAIDAKGQESLAAGVFFEGTKPVDESHESGPREVRA